MSPARSQANLKLRQEMRRYLIFEQIQFTAVLMHDPIQKTKASVCTDFLHSLHCNLQAEIETRLLLLENNPIGTT